MKIISWNVNGLRAQLKKPYLFDMIEKEKPSILCMGETKLTCPIDDVTKILNDKLPSYKYKYFSQCSIKKGYSGTAILSRYKPINIMYGIDNSTTNSTSNIDKEGRVITLEFNNFYLIHVYTPNSGELLLRLNYRVDTWDIEFRKYLAKLEFNKPIILCGDLNVANEIIDLHNPNGNKNTAGYTNEERNSFKLLLQNVNLIDTYRFLHPTKIEYSYWSYRHKARENNKGWRIDYFLISKKIITTVKKSTILTNIMGSDHAPIKLSIKLSIK